MAEIILANLTDITGFSSVGVTVSGTVFSSTIPGIYYIDQTGPFTFSLPSPSTLTVNNFVLVKDRDGVAGTSNITIVATGGVMIDGLSQITITTDYGAVFLSWNGANWSRL